MLPAVQTAIVDYLKSADWKSKIVFTGTVFSSNEQTKDGFDFGMLTIIDDTDGKAVTATVFNQNENLIAWSRRQQEPLIMAPDSICFITESGQPFSSADIDAHSIEGQIAHIVGVKARQNIRSNPTIMNSFSQAMSSVGYSGRQTDI